ncbi:baculoviral IAP repeat-containing protein 7-like [Haliotis cracherodii]|uniref:baculoviral IAP repeat-containing protein 7-like n=1 Tax=Haliotis cracherodii TaxID=6455 RepID=UPI0039E9A0FF
MTAVMARPCGLRSSYALTPTSSPDRSDCLDDDCHTMTKQAIMKSEVKRLNSFKLWPAWATQNPAILAQAGFYYTGTGDRVECPFCFGILKQWHTNDVPLLEHMKHFPYCNFIQGGDDGNIPIAESVQNSPVSRRSAQTQGVEGGCDYTREELRLKSFSRWPRNVSQTPEALARAGFYHIPCEEKPDRVKCGYCRGKVYNWACGDDPWIEHAKCFPTCPYIKLCIGEDVINDLLCQQNGVTSQENAEGVVISNSSDEVNSTVDEVTQLMMSDAVQAVLKMGFTSDLVRTVVHKWHTERCCDSVSAQELAIAVLEIGEGTGITTNNVNDTRSSTPNRRELRHEDINRHSSSNRGQISSQTLSDMTQNVDLMRTVQDENVHMRERYLCKVCMENQLRVTFMPCGHLACCGPCSMAMSDCPICRTPITGCVRSYF